MDEYMKECDNCSTVYVDRPSYHFDFDGPSCPVCALAHKIGYELKIHDGAVYGQMMEWVKPS